MVETASPIHYPLAGAPDKNGGYLEVRPGVFWLRMPLWESLDHINLWLLDEGDSWTLVDTGLGSQGCKEAWQRLAGELLRDKPVGRIIVTHFHPDHIGLAGYLHEKFQAPLAMTEVTAKRARFLLEDRGRERLEAIEAFCVLHGIKLTERYAKFIRGWRYREQVTALPEQIAFLDHQLPVMIGACEWQPMVVRGHAEDHLSLFCPPLELLISGDQVLPRITSNVSVHFSNADEDELAEYLASMDRFARLPEQTLVLPSHGRVFTGLHGRIAQIRRSHDQQLARTAELCAAPVNAWELAPRLFARSINDDNVLLAFGETLAHLKYLENRGRLETQFQGETCYYRQAG